MSSNSNLNYLNRLLSKYKKNEPIYLANIKADLVKEFNKEIPISLLEAFFADKGYLNIQLKKREVSNKSVTVTSEPSHSIAYEEDDDDFDPNIFIMQNQEQIKKTAIQTSTFADNKFIIKEYQNDRNVETLNEILTNNRGLVEKMANKYQKQLGHKLDYDDLVNEGFMGLMKAVEKFDLSLEYQFSTYATYWIRQAMTRAIVDKGYTIRVPVHMYESINKLLKIERESILKFDKLDVDWITAQLDITADKYNEYKKIDHAFLHLASLDSIVSVEDGDTSLIDFIEYNPALGLGSETEELLSPLLLTMQTELRTYLINCMDSLNEREREVLFYRFGWYDNKTKTLEEIGEIFGVTRERIRQIEAKALGKLRGLLDKRKVNFDVLHIDGVV